MSPTITLTCKGEQREVYCVTEGIGYIVVPHHGGLLIKTSVLMCTSHAIHHFTPNDKPDFILPRLAAAC